MQDSMTRKMVTMAVTSKFMMKFIVIMTSRVA